MAGTAIPYTIKCELLKSLIEKIQCHICKSVPGLVEDQQNRYVCKKGHCLCENCKDKICPSPCGSTSSNPNPVIQHLLKDLPAYCPHFKNGCTTIFSDSENRDDHMKGCIYREVNCPYFSCQSEDAQNGEKIIFIGKVSGKVHTMEESAKKQIMFKDLSDHMKAFHKEELNIKEKSNDNKFKNTYLVYEHEINEFTSFSTCTIIQTGTNYHKQEWYFCNTCSLKDGLGVCSVCSIICHRGHDVSYGKYSGGYCDCGAKGDKTCNSLVMGEIGTSFWSPNRLVTTDGSVFYAAAAIVKKSVYHWIYFLGSPQEVNCIYQPHFTTLSKI